MRFWIVVGAIVVLGVFAGLLAGCTDSNTDESSPEEGEQMKPQEVCPVMGGNINKEIYADYKGKRIYFCCPACIDTFKSDPEKYMGIMKEQGVEPGPVPESENK